MHACVAVGELIARRFTVISESQSRWTLARDSQRDSLIDWGVGDRCSKVWRLSANLFRLARWRVWRHVAKGVFKNMFAEPTCIATDAKPQSRFGAAGLSFFGTTYCLILPWQLYAEVFVPMSLTPLGFSFWGKSTSCGVRSH